VRTVLQVWTDKRKPYPRPYPQECPRSHNGRRSLTSSPESTTAGMSGTLPSVTETLLENPLVIDGSHFELIRPITDFRRDPNEARILYICRKVSNAATCDATHREEGSQDDEYVVKIKVQYVICLPRHGHRTLAHRTAGCHRYPLSINRHHCLAQANTLPPSCKH